MPSSRVFHIEQSAPVRADASIVYPLIADYHNGHPRIIPAPYFRNLKVVKGGFGAGTEITFEMVAFGRVTPTFAVITEPEPGRVLVESYPETGVVTTFRVEPVDHACIVTISTDFPMKPGLGGFIERLLLKPFLLKVYTAELKQIEQVARGGARA
jgi:hypothetical protein